MSTIRRILFVGAETIALAAFLIMLVSSVLQVIVRYVLDVPLAWTEEAARLTCVFTTYFGSIVTLLLREQIRVDLLDTMLSPRGRTVAAVIGNLLATWFLVIFLYGCWLMGQATWETSTATMAWFRMGHVYYGVGIAVVGMIAVLVLDLIADVTSVVRPAEAAPAESAR
jgi:TRAP-type C4-dicarboxylate transport system permease small subunit